MKKPIKSELEKQHQQLFSSGGGVDVTPQQPYPEYPSPMRVVQTVTTYSACEDPIPNPYKRS
jgi:hypothetical protein